MIRRSRPLQATLVLTVVAVLALLISQAIAGHDAAVIACQVLGMGTVAYGPYLVFRAVKAREAREQNGAGSGDADPPARAR